MTPPQILISAGEASSDMYAARLAIALRERTGAQFFGMGGPRMAEAGVELLADYHEVAVVGIAEVLHKIPSVFRVQRMLAREAVRRKASLAILVDSPGTHLGVARRLKNHGIPVGYFIGPQVWAWRSGRVRIVKRRVKRMVVIFPFEEKIYRDAGVPVDFVGHPLADVVKPTMTRAEFAARHGLAADRPIVALLPGSRGSEIARNFPIILEACERLTRGNEQRFRAAIRARGGARTREPVFSSTGGRTLRRDRETDRGRNLRRARRGRLRHRRQRHGDRRSRAAGNADGRGLPRCSAHGFHPPQNGPHSILQHGEFGGWAPRRSRADSGRFHSRAPSHPRFGASWNPVKPARR